MIIDQLPLLGTTISDDDEFPVEVGQKTYKTTLRAINKSPKELADQALTEARGKVDKEAGKGLSTNDYTTAEKNKLAGIETGANRTVVDDALSASSENPVQNKVVYEAINNIHIDVDSALSDSSENPVQNKVINAALADQKSVIDGKQDAPAGAGTAGQVLGLDDDLNPVWLDQTGGGGGTTNYNNLTNKPRINGALLSGDKSAADLGLAAASDIPSVPVQSVNGKTGAIVLDASDVGALPSSTEIPSKTSDLTNDSGFVNAAGAAAASPVQSVNGQTGDVTISVPSAASSGTPAMDGTANRGSSDEYARADHVHPHDTSKQDTITASGILKGNGSGGVSAAVAGTDYLTPATNYSPVKKVPRNQTYALTVDDIGKTFCEQWSSDASMNTVTWSLTAANSANMPVGAEIAFTYIYVANGYLSISGVRCLNVDLGEFATSTTPATVKFEKRSMIALKKLETSSVGDVWLLTGNVEVVS